MASKKKKRSRRLKNKSPDEVGPSASAVGENVPYTIAQNSIRNSTGQELKQDEYVANEYVTTFNEYVTRIDELKEEKLSLEIAVTEKQKTLDELVQQTDQQSQTSSSIKNEIETNESKKNQKEETGSTPFHKKFRELPIIAAQHISIFGTYFALHHIPIKKFILELEGMTIADALITSGILTGSSVGCREIAIMVKSVVTWLIQKNHRRKTTLSILEDELCCFVFGIIGGGCLWGCLYLAWFLFICFKTVKPIGKGDNGSSCRISHTLEYFEHFIR